MKRKISRMCMMLIAVMLAATACSSGSGSSTNEEEDWEDGFIEKEPATVQPKTETDDNAKVDNEERVTLTVNYFYENENMLATMKKAAEGYIAKHPGFRIDWKLIDASSSTNVADLIQSSDPHDVFWIPSWLTYQDFVTSGKLLDLSPYQGEMGGDAYYESLASRFTYDGRSYALPVASSSYVIYYNKKLMSGDMAPSLSWTYEDMIRSAKTIMKEQNSAGIVLAGILLQTAGQAYGGEALNTDRTQFELNERYREGLSVMLRALTEDRIDGRAEADWKNGTGFDSSINSDFFEGKVPMMAGYSWQLHDVLQRMPDVDIAPFPAGPAKQQGVGYTDGLAVSTASTHQQEAIELVQYLSGSEEANIVYVNDHYSLPLVLTDQVRAAWRSSFTDPSLAEKLEYIVQTDSGNMYTATAAPGFQNALVQFSNLLISPDKGLISGTRKLDDEFDRAIEKINADWKLEQDKAAKP
ncbi:extracellular solute-binding protein [Paenibacillus sp. PR3]|uniref:Extracellular solute-binding protein n=1 Tax=Paenibacillus terricola TaxID=2763503 RepID=A0ABR8MZ28_9BACL|nr:extracellular solute-binding protein [Paenibacillus terricola]MBD3921191.1 extracellular solute-binding protein [Paenibacillus terricola]